MTKREMLRNLMSGDNASFYTLWPSVRSHNPKSIVFPTAAKYSMAYRKSDGEVKTYVISNPIEDNGDDFTAYAFQRGVRTFKRSRVIDIQKV